MITGLAILIFTGILWVGIGSVISNAAHKNLNIAFIQGTSAALLMLLTLPVIFFAEIDIPLLSVIALLLSGAGNCGTFLLMNRAMKYGPNGLTWAMIQSAFIIPFLMGVIFFNVPCSLFRTLGIAILAAATIGMGICGKKEQNQCSGQNHFKWAFFTILAYCAAGLTQCCGNLPSYFVKEGEISLSNLIFRIGLSCTGIVVISVVKILIDRKFDFCKKGITSQIFIMAASSLFATLTLFYAMDVMTQHDAGAISYPVVTGVSIAAFIVYSAINLKEKIAPAAMFFVLLSLVGITMIAC